MGQKPWRVFKQAGCLLGILAGLCLILLPLSASICIKWFPDSSASLGKYLKWIEVAQRNSLSIIASLWFFFLGGCLASFLNVVTWRLPRGQSIWGHSRCPHCQKRLGPWDNFPVFGWLRNEGHCSICATPISPRYLVVEVILGSIFVLIACATLASGGITLPIRTPDAQAGFVRLLLNPQWDLLQIVAGHFCLVLFLFAFTLMDAERFPIPKPISKPIFLIGLLTGFSFSLLAPATFLMNYQWPMTNRWPMEWGSFNLNFTLLIGALAGATCGKILTTRWQPTSPTRKLPDNTASTVDRAERKAKNQDSDTLQTLSSNIPNRCDKKSVKSWANSQSGDKGQRPADFGQRNSNRSLYYGLALCGLFLGWQSVLILVAWLTVLLTTLSFCGSRGRACLKNPGGILLIACLIHLMTWRWMNYLGH